MTQMPTRMALLEQVHSLLKERVLDRSYRPGEKLNVDALARELSVSSTPVRESLGRMVAEGLVQTQPYVGFFVANMPTPGYFAQLFDLREILEVWAARESARLRPEKQMAVMQESVDAMSQYTLSKQYARFRGFSEADEAFHTSIIASTGNVPATISYANLRIHLHLSRLYINCDQDSIETRRQHAEILEAILAGRSNDAAARMKHHLRSSREKLLG